MDSIQSEVIGLKVRSDTLDRQILDYKSDVLQFYTDLSAARLQLLSLSKDIERLSGDLGTINRLVLVGNGTPALISRVQKLEQQHTANFERETKSEERNWNLVSNALVALISAGLTFLFTWLMS